MSSEKIIKILLLNLTLIIWRSSLTDVLKVLKKSVPYCLGAIIFSLYENPGDMAALIQKLIEVYSQRLIWEMIVLVYLS